MYINCGKSIGCLLDNQKIEDFITPFATNMVFQHIGLFWIIKSNKNLHFDSQKYCITWILNVPWYNNMICSRLHGLVFEEYFTTAKRDKSNLMCSIEAHKKPQKPVNQNKPINDETSSGGARPLPLNST